VATATNTKEHPAPDPIPSEQLRETWRAFLAAHQFDIGWPRVGTLVIDHDQLKAAIRRTIPPFTDADARADARAAAKCDQILVRLAEATKVFKHVRAREKPAARRQALRQFADAVTDLCEAGLQLETEGRPPETDWAAVDREWPNAVRLASQFYRLKARFKSPIAAWDSFANRDAIPASVKKPWCQGAWPRTARVLAIRYICTLYSLKPRALYRHLR
jgi:hypothetical protein